MQPVSTFKGKDQAKYQVDASLHRSDSAGARAESLSPVASGTLQSRSTSNLCNLAAVGSRHNTFSAPDEVLLERKGSAGKQSTDLSNRNPCHDEDHAHRWMNDRQTAVALPAVTLSRGTSRLAAELKVPEWLSPAQTRRPSLQGDCHLLLSASPEQHPEGLSSKSFERDTSATLAHMDQQQAAVLGSLQQLHSKLDTVAKALGILPEQLTQTSFKSAHHGSGHGQRTSDARQQEVIALMSQVALTLQQPRTAEEDATDRSSISTAIQKQLDSVSAQLASQGSAAYKQAESARLAAGVSDVIHHLQLAEQAIASACALTSSDCEQQEMPELLHTSRAISAAVISSSQLQLRMQDLTQLSSQTNMQTADENVEQMRSPIDKSLQGTYTALRQEFQTNVLYKGSEIEHVIKSVMRQQVQAGQKALADCASPYQADRRHPN